LAGGTPVTTYDLGTGTVTTVAQLVEPGGTAYLTVTASSAAAVKAAAGRLCKVIVLTTVTSAVSIYDNTNAASGNIVLTIPTTAVVGAIYPVDVPMSAGIYVGGGTGSPKVCVTYS
jgi:hypothetical protein